MSWDASLRCPHCQHENGDWSYTYNTTPMTIAAASAAGVEWEGFQRTLDGMTAHEGAVRLAAICDELTLNPATYEAMNPSNGWGDRTGIVRVMREMIDAGSTAGPDSVWRVS
jgi:hypothetical protein